MFERHSFTKEKYLIHYITNYEQLNKKKIDDEHINLLNNCDIFMYQPFNQVHLETEYDITNIKKYINQNAIIIKINYFRFRGFWYNSEYNPFGVHRNYLFTDTKYYGIHDSFKNFNSRNKSEIANKINNITFSSDEIFLFFNNELSKFKNLDDNSDLDMYDYFLNNYKTKHLFHDPFHPTNLFFYEMFRQIILKLHNYELEYEDYNFINLLNDVEMTNFALPILPSIKKILDLKLPDIIGVFYPHQRLYMDIYDYYYIRLSHENFENYLKIIGKIIRPKSKNTNIPKLRLLI
jgi:hypothetical protein